MRKNSPVKGLLNFSIHSSSGNFLIALMLCILIGMALIVTGNVALYSFFVAAAIGFPPMFFMMGSAGSGKSSKWERFRISMPVRRKDVITSNYLGVIATMVVAVPIFVVFSGLGVVIHTDLADLIRTSAVHEFVSFFSVALLSAALFYPLVNSIGGDKGDGLLIVCMLGGIGIMLGISWVGGRVDLADNIISISTLLVSTLTYFASFLITQKIYAKKDF